jgi:hypothetical protein
MSNRIERPIFYEGQVLGAADLTAGVEYGRGQQARHERFLHSWGIAGGLELTGADKETATGAKYKEVTLSTGVAIDGTGREIIVPENERLSEDLFADLNVAIADKNAWYPVFLLGRDEPAPQSALAATTCGSSQPSRLIEGFEIGFGGPGEELNVDKQDIPEITDGPPGNWRVLLGFVQWDATIKRFKDVAFESNGIGRRMAGVQADVVSARGGRLTLRTTPTNEAGKPALVIDEKDAWPLQFGRLTTQGTVTAVFKVNANGDVKAEGAITGLVTTGALYIQSGIATDGITLPLPPGITQKLVDDGQATLHIHLSPHFAIGIAPTNDISSFAVPIECGVDNARRVLCRFRLYKLNNSDAAQERPGACNYTIIASV